MKDISNRDIDWLLNLHNFADFTVQRKKSERFQKRRILFYLTAIVVSVAGLIVLPFFLLVRSSVYLYSIFPYSSWVAIFVGIIATVLLLLIYIYLLFRKVQNKKLLLRYSLLMTCLMVFSYCSYSLFYLSGIHAKTPQVRELYRSMHPILRVAVSTITLADNQLVITDIERNPENYAEMGLPINPNSLHFIQDDGYVHAVDLRTLNRGSIRNAILKLSLQGMGFETIRHTGTADHLHVQLPSSSVRKARFSVIIVPPSRNTRKPRMPIKKL